MAYITKDVSGNVHIYKNAGIFILFVAKSFSYLSFFLKYRIGVIFHYPKTAHGHL